MGLPQTADGNTRNATGLVAIAAKVIEKLINCKVHPDINTDIQVKYNYLMYNLRRYFVRIR